MKIYGVAVLALCYLAGKFLGNLLGQLLKIDGDVGGVGFAMLFLVLCLTFLNKKGWIVPETQKGILFWSGMYIPIIVAMAATQNVKAALTGGPLAILAGILATGAAFLFVPILSKIGVKKNQKK